MPTDPTTHFGEIRIEQLPPQHVAAYRAVSASPEEDAAEFMARWLTGQGVEEAAHRPNFGFDVEVTPEQDSAGLRGYEVWYPVPVTVQPSDAVAIRDFPGGLYAVMRLTNPFVDPFAIIPAGWSHIQAWCSAECDPGYQIGSHQHLERFIPDPDGPHLELFLPLVMAAAPDAG